jgi:hypothetical protein
VAVGENGESGGAGVPTNGAGAPGAVFRGVAELVLDAKGRMAIPARHRDGLASTPNGRLVITPIPAAACCSIR